MRYTKAHNLVRLALELQANRYGLTLADIQDRFAVGRRTAMRMRDAVLTIFPNCVETLGDDRQKRWHIPNGTLDRLLQFPAPQLAALESAARLFEQHNRTEEAAQLGEVLAKLKAVQRPEVARKIEPDLEALLEAEGLAMRPGPRPKISLRVVGALRHAMLASRQVRLRYRARGHTEAKDRVVHPYGFLHGHRHYLVAHHAHPEVNRPVLFSLPNIEDVTLLAEPFTRDPEFSLERFAEGAFGIWQEEPFEVVLRFLPEGADDARDFLFHPRQRQEEQEDGSLIVRFRAGGALEMAWHLYTWGTAVEVIEPARLAAMVHPHRASWPGRP